MHNVSFKGGDEIENLIDQVRAPLGFIRGNICKDGFVLVISILIFRYMAR